MSLRTAFASLFRNLGNRIAPDPDTDAYRSFVASRSNRITADWPLYTSILESEQQMSLRQLRHRSRWLARNNDYVKQFVRLVQDNIVGTGVTLQVKAETAGGKLDSATNRAVELAWWEWGKKKNASLNSRMTFLDICRLAVGKMASEGESLIELVPTTKNDFGFALKLHGADALDESHNLTLSNGNRVVMGVEIDSDDRTVAYWLTHPNDLRFAMREDRSVQRTRIPAEQMVHLFVPESESAVRGVPWLHTAMMRLRMLGAYEEAELVAARIGASKMGAYRKTSPDLDDDQKDAKLLAKVSAGQLIDLPPGVEIQMLNWDHPNSGYDKFIVAVLHGIAAGMGVSYEALTGDLKGVNYSSIRAGKQTERDVWRACQQHLIDHLCDPVYEAWFPEAVLAGKIQLAPRKLAAARMPVWRPRGWDYVNPVDEVNAAVTAINNGLSTITDELARRGYDVEEIAATREREIEIFSSKNIPLAAPKSAPAALSTDTPNVPDGNSAQSGTL